MMVLAPAGTGYAPICCFMSARLTAVATTRSITSPALRTGIDVRSQTMSSGAPAPRTITARIEGVRSRPVIGDNVHQSDSGRS